MPSMTRSLRDQLVASLDSVVVAYEDYLQAEKEKCYSQDWNLFSYVDSQFSLSQLYGALGLQDQVLAQYDELNALFSVLIWNLSPKGEKPSWLEVFLNESPARCPSLLLNAKATSNSAVALSEGRMSLVEFRVLLLARQLVALLDQYNFRLQSVPSGSIQTQFCGLLLEYADNCLRSIFEELKLLKIEWPDYFRCCWICLFCEEVFHLCARLCDPVQVDSAAENTCHLWVEFCYSLFEVGVACGFVSKRCSGSLECSRNKDLLSWLPDATEVDGCMKQGKDGTSPVAKIQQLLRAKVNFQFQFKKHCENSMAVLKHFKWKRHARMLGKLLADFLIYSDLPNCLESALPYYLKLLNSLAREKWEGAYICLLKETIQHFEQSPSFEHQLVRWHTVVTDQGTRTVIAIDMEHSVKALSCSVL